MEIGAAVSDSFTPVQSPSSLPLTSFTLKRRNDVNGTQPVPGFINLTLSQDGLSVEISCSPINPYDVNTWDNLYVEVSV